MSVGILCSYIVGSLVKWDTLAWCSSSVTLLLGFIMLPMPESPVWLRSKNRFREAEEAVKWLKLELPPVELLSAEEKAVAVALLEKPNETDASKARFSEVIFTRPLFMPLAIGLTLLVLQQVSGIDAIVFFTVEIFRESGE